MNVLSDRDTERLKKILAAYEKGELARPLPVEKNDLKGPVEIYLMQLLEALNAASESSGNLVPSSASAKLAKHDVINNKIIETNVPITIYNMSKTAGFASGEYVYACRDAISGHYFAFQTFSSNMYDQLNNSNCCADAVKTSSLVVEEKYCKTYELGGQMQGVLAPHGTYVAGGTHNYLRYVGTASGLTGVPDGSLYWESDNWSCACLDADGNSTSSDYKWRLVAEIDGDNNCVGSGKAYLYLVLNSGTDNCTYTSWGSGSYGDPVKQYTNLEDWRPRAGVLFYAVKPTAQNQHLEEIMPCKVCIMPVDGSVTVSGTCWLSLATLLNRDPTTFPGQLKLAIDNIVSYTNSDTTDRIYQHPELAYTLVWDGSTKYTNAGDTTNSWGFKVSCTDVPSNCGTYLQSSATIEAGCSAAYDPTQYIYLGITFNNPDGAAQDQFVIYNQGYTIDSTDPLHITITCTIASPWTWTDVGTCTCYLIEE